MIAAAALGQAIQTHDGLYDRGGLVCLTVAMIACGAAFVPAVTRRLRLDLRATLAAVLLLQFMELFLHRPASETALARGVRATLFPHACLGIAAIAAVMIAAGSKLWRAAFWVAVVAILCAGLWVIQATPDPHMDVWWAQQAGLSALTEGKSPFSSKFPDIYEGAAFYPEWLRSGELIDVGFPYPPLTLALSLPSFLATGDLRYGNAIYLALAAIIIAHLSRRRTAALAALLLLTTPRVFFVLESGWTEPSVILCFAIAVFCAVHAVKALPMALGLAVVSKQNMPLMLPLVPLLREQLRTLRGRPVLFLAAIVAPLASVFAVLPDVRGFLRSSVLFPAQVPLRTDILSYPAMFANELGFQSSPLAIALGFGASIATILVMLRRAPRTPSGFAAACGATFLVFFAFNKYAACNYYFFVIAVLCCAAAAHADGEIEPDLAIT